MLDKIPLEILDLILDFVDTDGLLNMYQLCHSLFIAISPRLHWIFKSRIDRLPRKWDARPDEFRFPLNDRRTLKFVKHLRIVDEYRRSYSTKGYFCLEKFHSVDGEGKSLRDKLGCDLMPVFRGLTRNSLLTFNWDIGACIPLQILGPSGYLPRHQRNIECLYLRTRECRPWSAPRYKLSISRFHRVRKLRWEGLHNMYDCIALMEFFRANAGRLEDLDLHVGHWLGRSDWKKLPKNWAKEMALVPRDWNVFAFKIIGVEMGEERTIFPRLDSLSLAGVSFSYAINEMAYAFRADNLRSLKLHNCANTPQFLAAIALMGGDINVVSLELELSPSDDSLHDYTESFFESSLPKIEDVFLYVTASYGDFTDSYWKSIFRPGRALKRFIYHRRWDVRDVISEELVVDSPLCWNKDMVKLLTAANLECIGLCDHPLSLLKQFSRSPSLSCKILHVRASAHIGCRIEHLDNILDLEDLAASLVNPSTIATITEEVHSRYREWISKHELTHFLTFAQWAFGQDGLPQLETLVYGGMVVYGLPAIILCRNNTPSLDRTFSMAGDDEAGLLTKLLGEARLHMDFFKVGSNAD